MQEAFDERTRMGERLATVKVAGVSAASARRGDHLHAQRIAKNAGFCERK